MASYEEVKTHLASTKMSLLYGEGVIIEDSDNNAIAKTSSEEKAEGVVKNHHNYVRSLFLLELIRNQTKDPNIKHLIERHFDDCMD